MRAARIVEVNEIGHGVTKPLRATMELEGFQHSAKIQSITRDLGDFYAEDGGRAPMLDHWRFNIAAYKVDRLVGLNRVVVGVERAYQGKPCAFTWWADDVMMEDVERVRQHRTPPDPEKYERERAEIFVFDELIINFDRNLSNLLINKQWDLVAIDHSRSFIPYSGIRNKRNLTRCSRKLLDGMKKLTAKDVQAAAGKYLTSKETAALIARRDLIVAFFAEKAKTLGEENVLF